MGSRRLRVSTWREKWEAYRAAISRPNCRYPIGERAELAVWTVLVVNLAYLLAAYRERKMAAAALGSSSLMRNWIVQASEKRSRIAMLKMPRWRKIWRNPEAEMATRKRL